MNNFIKSIKYVSKLLSPLFWRRMISLLVFRKNKINIFLSRISGEKILNEFNDLNNNFYIKEIVVALPMILKYISPDKYFAVILKCLELNDDESLGKVLKKDNCHGLSLWMFKIVRESFYMDSPHYGPKLIFKYPFDLIFKNLNKYFDYGFLNQVDLNKKEGEGRLNPEND